jgi:DNA-binding beta-propeller fold protein YncE
VFSKADGVFVRQWGTKGDTDGQFYFPRGVAVDSEHVYVSDGNHRVQVFCKADGAFVRTWGSLGAADGQFISPYGVAVDTEHAYVVDSQNHRLQVFS